MSASVRPDGAKESNPRRVTDEAYSLGLGSVDGYEWDDDNPRVRLEPRGERGYIELRAVRPAGKR